MAKYPDMGEITGLRLELGRERDRANALESALRKEVLAIVRDGIAEYERLKTDIYRLRHERIRDLNTYGGQQEEIARLKAEVERLESMADENAHLHKGIYSLSLNVGQLKDEVERLRKAGDAMAETLEAVGFDSAMDFWNAANREQGCLVNPIKVAQYLPKPPTKEGKPSV